MKSSIFFIFFAEILNIIFLLTSLCVAYELPTCKRYGGDLQFADYQMSDICHGYLGSRPPLLAKCPDGKAMDSTDQFGFFFLPANQCARPGKSTELFQEYKKGVECIASWEGFCPTCYQDQACLWTIGIGFLVGNGKNETACKKMEPMSSEDAMNKFKSKLNKYEQYVRQYVKKSLNNDQFDALVSFAYNVGEGGIKNLANTINTNGFSEVRSKMAEYNKITDKNGEKVISNGLANRRKFEAGMFESKIKTCPGVSKNCNGGCKK
ncbi:lysozyme [Gigaspora margarita]|uniref:Lysozyme n=1 Tax=Gigaspora margarita TaxID=4874 RepID=A0A8H4B2S2_GIGMA|nr:lysozyme [Gigaspora margarita]